MVHEWPDVHHGYGARAVALAGLGRFREAAGDIEVALGKRDLRRYRLVAAAIYQKLAMQYERAGNRAQSYRSLKRAWEVLPEADRERHREIEEDWKQMEAEYAALVAPLHRAVDANEQDFESWLKLAAVYASFGYYEPAGKIFHRLLGSERPESGNPRVLFAYARYFWETRDTEEGYREAARVYRIILDAQPGHADARDGLARCEAELGKLE